MLPSSTNNTKHKFNISVYTAVHCRANYNKKKSLECPRAYRKTSEPRTLSFTHTDIIYKYN